MLHSPAFRSLSTPRVRRPAASLIVAATLAAVLSACSGSGGQRANRPSTDTRAQSSAPAPTTTSMGPRTPQASDPGAAPAPAKPVAQAAPSGDASGDPQAPVAEKAPPVAAQRAPNGARDDGRPNWWFAEARRAEGLVQVCAEALGVDMAGARDAALAAARTRVRRELGLLESQSIPSEQIERAWVWPLPNSRVGPSRYAGYVWIAAADAD